MVLGKINFPLKIDFRIRCHLEKNMKRLSESRKVLSANLAPPSPEAKIIFTKAPFIQYEQLLLDKNVMGGKKTPIQKTCEISTGQDSSNIDFLGANRQFDWIEIFIVYDKSDKHTSIYDSYSVEFNTIANQLQ